MGVQDYFGGSARFSSENTFLGRKIVAQQQAVVGPNEAMEIERVLGTSNRARYGAVQERLAGGAVPLLTGTKLPDQERDVNAVIDPRIKAAQAAKPRDWTMDPNVNKRLAEYAEFDPKDPKAVAAFYKEMGVDVDNQGIPITDPDDVSETGTSITSVANGYIGVANYRYGAWDCSAFTQRVVDRATGLDIGRDTAAQMAFFKKHDLFATNIGYARPGDVLYFRSGQSQSGRHTGIYVGNGMMIDNAGTGKPIKLRSIAGRVLLGVGLVTRM